MNIDQIHPELRATYARIPAVPFHNPILYFFINTLQKLRPKKAMPATGVSISDFPLGSASVRVYRPQDVLSGAAAMWIHGGGYILGDVTTNDRECCQLANELGLVVVSVDYRLAPKHPFPAALDDCFAAWQFMLDHAVQWGVEPQRMAVMGQSAGGGLAAAVVQRIADTDGVQPAAQVLIYPMLDDRTAANTSLDAVKNRLWNNKNNRGAWRWYLGQPVGQAKLPPYAAPARQEDVSRLPATWIGVGDLDLFYEEDCQYAERLRQAQIPCELYVVPQAPHGFDLLVPEAPVTRAFCNNYYQFLRGRLSLKPGLGE